MVLAHSQPRLRFVFLCVCLFWRTSPQWELGLASRSELVNGLKLPKFPARDLKRALEQAASVRALNHTVSAVSAEIRRNPQSTHGAAAYLRQPRSSAAEHCGGLRTLPRMYHTAPHSTAEDSTIRTIVRCTAEVMHGYRSHARHECAIAGTDEAHRRPPLRRLPVYMQTHDMPKLHTRTHTHTHTNKHTHTHTHTLLTAATSHLGVVSHFGPQGSPTAMGFGGGASLSSLYRKRRRRGRSISASRRMSSAMRI